MSKDAYFRPNEHKSPFDVGTNLFVPENCTDKSVPTLFEHYHLNLIRDKTIKKRSIVGTNLFVPKNCTDKSAPTLFEQYHLNLIRDRTIRRGEL